MGQSIADVECEYIQHRDDVSIFCILQKGHFPDTQHKFRFQKDGKEYIYPAWEVKKKE